MLYTFIIEHMGSTVLEQHYGKSTKEAFLNWRANSNFLNSGYFGDSDDYPVPVDGLKNVWCYSFLKKDESLILVHIIKTSENGGE